MARQLKDGLDYFPLDIDIEQDDKIFDLEEEMGVVGFALLIKLYVKIYHNSYYTKWGEMEEKRFAKQNSTTRDEVKRFIESCCKSDIVSEEIYRQHKVLTSKGIQRRYLEATVRRLRVEVIKEYLLIEINEYKNVVIVSNNVNVNKTDDPLSGVNVDILLHDENINSQSKAKESKVK